MVTNFEVCVRKRHIVRWFIVIRFESLNKAAKRTLMMKFSKGPMFKGAMSRGYFCLR